MKAYPGREAAERNAVLRALAPPAPREKPTLARGPAHATVAGAALTGRRGRAPGRMRQLDQRMLSQAMSALGRRGRRPPNKMFGF